MTAPGCRTRLRLDVTDGVARITLAEPDRGNPIDPRWVRELWAVANELHDRIDVRAVLLEATGWAFCVGGDVGHLAASGDPGTASEMLARDLHAGMLALSELDAPLVVAVQGVAAGAGMSLALAADVVIAGRSASFVAAYTALGLSCDGGCSYWLPRLVGHRRATELMLTNRRVGADEAAAIGIVTEVVDDLDLADRASSVAAALAGGPTAAYGALRRLLATSAGATYAQQLDDEAHALGQLADSAHSREQVAAFLGRRIVGL